MQWAFNAYASGANDLVFIGSIKNVMTQSILAKPEITKLEQLRAKRVGVTRIGSNTHFFTVQVFRRAGMNPDKDITFIQTGGDNETLGALVKDEPALLSGHILPDDRGFVSYAQLSAAARKLPQFEAGDRNRLIRWDNRGKVAYKGVSFAPRAAVFSPDGRLVVGVGVERGEIESSSNVEVRCEVQGRGSAGTAIIEIVPEGKYVEKGDFLVKLDDSALQADLVQQQIGANTSRALMVEAQLSSVYDFAIQTTSAPASRITNGYSERILCATQHSILSCRHRLRAQRR